MVPSSSPIQHPFSHVGDASTRHELNDHNPEFLFRHSDSRALKLNGEFEPDLSVCPPPPPPSPSSSHFPLSNAILIAGNTNTPTGRPVTAPAAVGWHGVDAGGHGLHQEPTLAARSAGGILPDSNGTSFTGRYPSVNSPAPVHNHTNLQNNQSTNSVTCLTKKTATEVDGEANADLLALWLHSTSPSGRAPGFRWNGQGIAVSNCEEQYGHGCVVEHRSV